MVSTVVSSPLAVLMREFREEVPAGLATPLMAGLVIADVLRALGWTEQAISALVPEVGALETVGNVDRPS